MTTAIIVTDNQPLVERQAATDAQLIELWLHGRCSTTQREYRSEAEHFLAFVARPLHEVTLADLQRFSSALEDADLAPATRRRSLAAIKSLFAFAHRLGYLPFDTSRPLRLPGSRDTLNQRILDEAQVQRIIALEANPRNGAILYLLYASGVRVSELCGLKWADCQPRDNGGQITVFGKGQKTRTVLLPASVWSKLVALNAGRDDQKPVFVSRKRGHLHPSQVLRIVKAAARRAGVSDAVSPHWFRHAHASHALDRGAPISLVQTTLGHADISTTGRYLHARPSDSSSRYLPL